MSQRTASERTSVSAALLRVQVFSLLVGLAGTAGLVYGWLHEREQLFESYLVAYLYWLGPALGSLAVVMLHNMTGGAWGFAVKRLLEAGMRTIPFAMLLFVPLLFGTHSLYEWMHADVVAADPVLQAKQAYLNEPFFLGRAALYFVVWNVLAFGLALLASRYDRTLRVSALRGMRVFSGFGLVAYVLTMSFASFDWAMSLEPHWFSTIYGVQFVVGQVLTTLCIAIVVASRLARHEPFSRWLRESHFHDLGNLLMAFVMLWAYMSFSQFLIVWSGNLPEETPWYLHRLHHGWQVLALVLVVLHFAVPFLVLLARRSKRNARALSTLAIALLVLRYADYYWLIEPAFLPADQHHSEFAPHWLDLVAPIAVGGLWIAAFTFNLRGRPLVSLQDGRMLGQLEEARG